MWGIGGVVGADGSRAAVVNLLRRSMGRRTAVMVPGSVIGAAGNDKRRGPRGTRVSMVLIIAEIAPAGGSGVRGGRLRGRRKYLRRPGAAVRQRRAAGEGGRIRCDGEGLYSAAEWASMPLGARSDQKNQGSMYRGSDPHLALALLLAIAQN